MPSILVVGDLILDRYLYGRSDRKSPEADVPVFAVEYQECFPGGAAAVAKMAAGLGADVTLCGVVGHDEAGMTLLGNMHPVQCEVVRSYRPTTTKTRLLVDRRQQFCRIDDEVNDPWDYEMRLRVADYYAVLIADYGKGVCTERLLRHVIESANVAGVPVLVDPARGVPWDRYEGATVIKCNESEWADHWSGCNYSRHVVVTKGADGMLLDGDHYFAAMPIVPVDMCGAGDMVLAAMGVCLAKGWSLEASCRYANVAAGLKCLNRGAVAVDGDLVEATLSLNTTTAS